MDNLESKLLLGKLLGEVYRLQKKVGMSLAYGDSHTFGLLHGFESEINDAIERIGFISSTELDAAAEILDEIFIDENKVKNFKGFYDIEAKLESRGIDRSKAIKILSYFKSNGQFTNLIDKMNSIDSPVECREFDLDEWDK